MTDGFVLAGGRARRMGVDKARLAWDGQPLAACVAQVLATRCGRVALIRRQDDGLPWPGLSVILEPPHVGTHPLFGVAAALEASQTALTLIAPCDLPFLMPDHLDQLLPGPAVATCAGRVHPLLAVIPSGWADRVKAAAIDGVSAQSVLGFLPRVDLPARGLRNVNQPRDRPSLGPVQRLVESLLWLDPEDRLRVEKGERCRLASHGMVDVRYPAAPHNGEDE